MDLHQAVDPLIRQIGQYDALRQHLEKDGGIIMDLNMLSDIMSREFNLEGYYYRSKVSLTNPANIKSALYDCDERSVIQSFILGIGGREIKTGKAAR